MAHIFVQSYCEKWKIRFLSDGTNYFTGLMQRIFSNFSQSKWINISHFNSKLLKYPSAIWYFAWYSVNLLRLTEIFANQQEKWQKLDQAWDFIETKQKKTPSNWCDWTWHSFDISKQCVQEVKKPTEIAWNS